MFVDYDNLSFDAITCYAFWPTAVRRVAWTIVAGSGHRLIKVDIEVEVTRACVPFDAFSKAVFSWCRRLLGSDDGGECGNSCRED